MKSFENRLSTFEHVLSTRESAPWKFLASERDFTRSQYPRATRAAANKWTSWRKASLCLYLAHTHTLSLSCTHTHTLSRTHTATLSFTHKFSLSSICMHRHAHSISSCGSYPRVPGLSGTAPPPRTNVRLQAQASLRVLGGSAFVQGRFPCNPQHPSNP